MSMSGLSFLVHCLCYGSTIHTCTQMTKLRQWQKFIFIRIFNKVPSDRKCTERSFFHVVLLQQWKKCDDSSMYCSLLCSSLWNHHQFFSVFYKSCCYFFLQNIVFQIRNKPYFWPESVCHSTDDCFKKSRTVVLKFLHFICRTLLCFTPVQIRLILQIYVARQ